MLGKGSHLTTAERPTFLWGPVRRADVSALSNKAAGWFLLVFTIATVL